MRLTMTDGPNVEIEGGRRLITIKTPQWFVATICILGLVVDPFLPESSGKPLSETK